MKKKDITKTNMKMFTKEFKGTILLGQAMFQHQPSGLLVEGLAVFAPPASTLMETLGASLVYEVVV